MRFEFLVFIEVTRNEGQFATRDEIAEQISAALDDANPGTIEGDNGGQYDVEAWEVEEQAQVKARRLRKTTHVKTARVPTDTTDPEEAE